jgi:type I restriction-modification system DNA methylase subunit
MVKSLEKWQFGDFQTPDRLAQEVVKVLKLNHKISPKSIIEPSCGKGSFVRAALKEFTHSKLLGLDINEKYVEAANLSISKYLNSANATIYQSDFFNTDWKSLISNLSGDILIIGNPPWVTSSELSILNSQNLPVKSKLFDDTVNFLSFETEEEAKFIFGLVTSDPALEFLDSMIFWDEKRPITIDILRRLSLKAVARELGSLENYLQWTDSNFRDN